MSQPPTMNELVTLSAEVGAQLAGRDLSVAVAESCSGGLLASILTDVPGSSDYTNGGVVAYSNQAKISLLGVREETLQAHGAVSGETAAEMARGVRRLLGSTLGLSTTGIAGPGGGTADKPVGLIYLHLSAPGAELGERHLWPYDRSGNKAAAVGAALALAKRYLQSGDAARPGQQPQVLDRPVIVEASWRAGQWRPQAVWLEDRRWPIIGWGRQNERPDGSRAVLVEAEGGARFELLVDVKEGLWRLHRVWWPRHVV